MSLENSIHSAIVTGASGFLGSHLCDRLIMEGFKVIAIDNFATGLRSNAEYLKKTYKKELLTFIEKDVVQDWKYILTEISPGWLENLKYIFHFASPASPPHYQKLSIETIRVNTIGLERAIRFADQYQARVVFSSTSEVYGDPEVSPQPENYWGRVNCFGPRSCYDEAKRCGEAIIFSMNERNKTKHGLVRIFNTYGPRMNPNDGRVVINFLIQALSGEALTIYGDGSQTRSFCYVDDLIDGIFRYAQLDIHKPVNLGNPDEFTVKELAEIVQKMFPEKKLKIVYKNLPGDDPRQRRPDISIANKLLKNWEPKIKLSEGLSKMLKEMSK